MVDAYRLPGGLKLIRQNAGDGGADMLPHLGADDVHGDDPIRGHRKPLGGLERLDFSALAAGGQKTEG